MPAAYDGAGGGWLWLAEDGVGGCVAGKGSGVGIMNIIC